MILRTVDARISAGLLSSSSQARTTMLYKIILWHAIIITPVEEVSVLKITQKVVNGFR